MTDGLILGGAFEGIEDHESPFGYKKGEGIDAGSGEVDWICSRDRPRTDPLFETLNPIDGKISGAGMFNFSFPKIVQNNRTFCFSCQV